MKLLPSYAMLLLLLSGCEREERAFYQETSGKELVVALSPLSPGDGKPQILASPDAETYQQNAWHLSEGKRLFTSFNCSGCHGNGGGGSGPALMDGRWIYGGNIENIVATIREGRPNGMPSFRGKITDNQIWQIAAFVRSLIISPLPSCFNGSDIGMTDGAIVTDDSGVLFGTKCRSQKFDQPRTSPRDDPWRNRVIALWNWLHVVSA